MPAFLRRTVSGALGVAVSLIFAARGEVSAASDHWAYQPARSVALGDPSGWAKNEIDVFVAARLQKHGLTPNPPTSKRTLIRRASFDLIGLPPTPQEVDAFLADDSPDAFAKVIDRLLASSHYGERWGRHWLDLARYADTSGDGADAPIPEAYLYRDYVIESFNEDLSYDDFIREQIAGDLLVARDPETRTRERLIATSYVGLTRRFNNGEYRDMHLVIENTLATIGRGMLGVSLECARCHDHKFDPISMDDYYGLYGYFESTQYPHAGTESGRKRKNFTELPGGGLAYAVFDKRDNEEIGDARIQEAGEPRQKGDRVPRGFLDVIDDSEAEIPDGESGRLQLAEWIASPENPLTARVMVNRIWQYHFGTGLVATSSDFGAQGSEPSHPALLDWLAERFVQDGWSFKKMHKLIMLSQTYQLSSAASDNGEAKDPANRLLWRYPRHRLEAEPMRDAVLFVSGRLKTGSPGRHPFPEPNKKDEYPYTQHRPFREDYHHDYRTVYLPSRRLGKHPYMELFNGPDPNECTARRSVSTVPLQALYWMNSGFIRDAAISMANRIAPSGENAQDPIESAYRLAYGRPPSASEHREMRGYLDRYARQVKDSDGRSADLRALTSLCRILLSSNEFVYLD